MIASDVSGASRAAGVQVGDQVVRANGVDIVTVEDLATLIEAAPLSTGGKLEVDVVRGGVQKLRFNIFVDDRSGVNEKKKQRHLHV